MIFLHNWYRNKIRKNAGKKQGQKQKAGYRVVRKTGF
jgi:hypothetical protein